MRPGPDRRAAVAVLAVLLCAYATTLGLDVAPGVPYAGAEPHHLLAARSLLEDADLDVVDEYRAGAPAEVGTPGLRPAGALRGGALVEPFGAGLSVLIVPAYALGGALGAELLLAVVVALAGTFGYLLARQVVPNPWALGAALAVGLSPPLLLGSTALYPDALGAALLAGAAVLATGLTGRPTRTRALTCFAVLALLPWVAVKLVPAGLVIALAAWRALGRARRLALRTACLELLAVSAIGLFLVNRMLYGGLTPYAVAALGGSPTGAISPLDHATRAYRLVALFLDRDWGLLRWAPIFALGLVGLYVLYRGRRENLGRALPGYRDAERTAGVCAVAFGAALVVAAFLAPTVDGPWFPPRHLVAVLPLAVPLVALGARRLPRIAIALGTLTLVASAWTTVALRIGAGDLAGDRPNAPLGPLEVVFPSFGSGPGPYVLAAVVAAGLAGLLAADAVRSRRAVEEAPG